MSGSYETSEETDEHQVDQPAGEPLNLSRDVGGDHADRQAVDGREDGLPPVSPAVYRPKVIGVGRLVPPHAALVCVLAIAGYFVLAGPASLLVGPQSGWFLAVMMIGMFLANVGASFTTTWIAAAPSVRSLRLGRPRPAAVAGGVAFGFAAYLFNSSIVGRLYDYEGGLEYAVEVGELFAAMEASTGLLLAFLLTAILVPFGEEVLFRGAILGGLAGRWSPWPAIVVSAVVFGLFHVQPVHMLIAFGLGLLAGWATIASGSLWPAIAAHAINNGISYFSLGGETLEEGLLHPAWSLVGVALVVLGRQLLRVEGCPPEAAEPWSEG